MELSIDPDWTDPVFETSYIESVLDTLTFAGNAVNGYTLTVVPDYNL
jgi:hypothetical protein